MITNDETFSISSIYLSKFAVVGASVPMSSLSFSVVSVIYRSLRFLISSSPFRSKMLSSIAKKTLKCCNVKCKITSSDCCFSTNMLHTDVVSMLQYMTQKKYIISGIWLVDPLWKYACPFCPRYFIIILIIQLNTVRKEVALENR